MRISQLKTLCWVGNLVVLAGVGWTVLQFVDAYQARAQKLEVVWPGEDKPVRGIERSWPGDLGAFSHIWETPVDGEVPKPDTGPAVVVDKRTEAEKFKQGTFFRGGIIHDDTVQSIVRIERGGKILYALVGEIIDNWQLIGVTGSVEGAAVATFQHVDPSVTDLVLLEEELIEMPFKDGDMPFQRVVDDDPDSPVGPDPERKVLKRQAYVADRAKPNDWTVPPEEWHWWRRWGASEVFEKASFATKKDADGHAVGLEVRSSLGAGTPVARGRGIHKGDVIKSINGTPITSEEDAARYLREEGKGLDRYEVEVEDATGKTRTMTYRFASR